MVEVDFVSKDLGGPIMPKAYYQSKVSLKARYNKHRAQFYNQYRSQRMHGHSSQSLAQQVQAFEALNEFETINNIIVDNNHDQRKNTESDQKTLRSSQIKEKGKELGENNFLLI